MRTNIAPKTVQHLWSIVCSNSVVDAESNNISLNNILEEIQVSHGKSTLEESVSRKGIIVPINFEVVSLWKKLIDKNNDLNTNTEVRVIDPNGNLLAQFPYKLEIKKGLERLRTRLKFNGLKVTIPGEYTFKINIEENGVFVNAGDAYLQVKLAVNRSG